MPDTLQAARTAEDLSQDLQDDVLALLEASGAMVVLARSVCETGVPLGRYENHGIVWVAERLAEMVQALSKKIDAEIGG